MREKIVLVGAGHSHLVAIRHWLQHSMLQDKALDITLINPEAKAYYSGMVTGYLMGEYRRRDLSIDISALLKASSIQFKIGSIKHLNPIAQRLTLEDGTTIAYDILSLNIGGCVSTLMSDNPNYYPIKPLSRFLEVWPHFMMELMKKKAPIKLHIIGGGVSAIEIAMCLNYGLLHHGNISQPYQITLLMCGDDILSDWPQKMRDTVKRALVRCRIQIQTRTTVTVDSGITSDCIIDCRGVSPAEWVCDSGLETDNNGFIAIKPTLQTVSYDNIFACGDIATIKSVVCEKAGVFAVKQGVPLAENILLTVRKQVLKSYYPQKQYLKLINMGGRCVMGVRGRWCATGTWLWHLKDWIDRRFVNSFRL